MTSVQEYDGQIKDQLDELEKLLDKISKAEGTKRASQVKTCQLKIKNIQNDLETYEFEISNLDRHEEAKYRVSFNQLQGRLRIAKNEFELKKNEGNQAAEQLFAGRKNQFKEDLENQDLRQLDRKASSTCNNKHIQGRVLLTHFVISSFSFLDYNLL